MIDARKTTRRKPDPVAAALRRLLDATDRNIRAADEVRRARIALARLTAGDQSEEGLADD